MLEARGLRGGYRKVDVIADIDLRLNAGESVALLGPNGAGKSTVLAALTATLPRRSGAIVFNGRDVSAEPGHRLVAAGLALVPEGRQIFAPFTVRDNLRLGAIALSREHRIAERFDYVFTLFPRLAERASQRAGAMSGGEQQMLAIGRALMSAPRLLLLDEPFLGLAPMIVEEILATLARMRADGMTTLIVEQKLEIALACATRAYVMVNGRVARHASCAELAAGGDLRDVYFSAK
jgi:branched-chain amino acid transport system ATP-binding protein